MGENRCNPDVEYFSCGILKRKVAKNHIHTLFINKKKFFVSSILLTFDCCFALDFYFRTDKIMRENREIREWILAEAFGNFFLRLFFSSFRPWPY